MLVLALYVVGIERVSFEQLQDGGWKSMKGCVVEITTPLVVCGTFHDSIYLAPERLYVPEERAKGLSEGDSTEYYKWVEYNDRLRIRMECPKPYDLNLGATIKGLRAMITGERSLLTGRQPNFKNYKPQTALPNLGWADIVICSTNIQNYFVHQGGYATKRQTDGQHALQCLKVASALVKMNADLYAICEIEKGESAPKELAGKMNELSGKEKFDFVRISKVDGDTISVGLIYDKTKLRPYGELCFAYPKKVNIYSCRFVLQGFEAIESGERFVVSLNHLRSKRGSQEESLDKRMANVEALTDCIQEAYNDSIYTDPDIIVLGDFNSYTQEKPIQTMIELGYKDMLFINDSLNYSYSYKGECGYLDRVFSSPTMSAQITAVYPIHWNTDYYYSAAYYSKYNFKNRIIPKEKPQNIKKYMSKAAKKNLLFRYSDHDPILIGLKLGNK